MQAPIAQLNLPNLPNPADLLPDLGIPGPGDLLKGIFGWILEQLGISKDNSLKTAVDVLESSREPNVFTEWYAYAFGNSLGLALHLALLMVAISTFVVLLHRNGWHRIGSNLLNVLVLAWWGEIFFFMLVPVFMLSDGMTQIMKFFATLPADNSKDWMDSLLVLPAVADIFGNVLVSWTGTLIGWALSAEVFIIAVGIYVVGIMSIFSFPLRNSGVGGERFFRWTVNLFFVVVFTKPFMMFWLAFGSALIELGPGVPGMNIELGVSLLFTLMAALTPILLLILSNKVYAKVQGHIKSEVKGDVRSEEKSHSQIHAASVDHHIRSVDLSGHSAHMDISKTDRSHTFRQVVEQQLIKAAIAKTHPVVGAAVYVQGRRRNGKSED